MCKFGLVFEWDRILFLFTRALIVLIIIGDIVDEVWCHFYNKAKIKKNLTKKNTNKKSKIKKIKKIRLKITKKNHNKIPSKTY